MCLVLDLGSKGLRVDVVFGFRGVYEGLGLGFKMPRGSLHKARHVGAEACITAKLLSPVPCTA